jgi:hypothetical protein
MISRPNCSRAYGKAAHRGRKNVVKQAYHGAWETKKGRKRDQRSITLSRAHLPMTYWAPPLQRLYHITVVPQGGDKVLNRGVSGGQLFKPYHLRHKYDEAVKPHNPTHHNSVQSALPQKNTHTLCQLF